ncbi:MAG: glycosyltransferase [Pantoea sp.]|uniref:glycosyltransferase family 2 protein n=1 Tax=Pantoea sp. TaxID=69393 RepID=UPI0023A2239C|nr:glycosyltransferase [Pantoea sp.]MDE1187846.1 glycosyltransferase [Pantoea sp.]
MTKVSIIINNYNYGNFIEDAIISALNQNLSQTQLIVVDDGSSDNSRSIIDNYKDRVDFLYQENGGQASALNAGFLLADGDIIIFLDSDDRLHANCASEVVAAWRPGVSKINYNLEIIDGLGNNEGIRYFKEDLPRGNLKEQTLFTGMVASPPMTANAFSRSFLERVMPIPETLWRSAADVYLFSLATLCGEIVAIDKNLGEYRVHNSNDSKPIKNGKISRGWIDNIVKREFETDKAIADFARSSGLPYTPGTITSGLAHIQLKMIFIITHSLSRKGLLLTALTALKRQKISAFKSAAIAVWTVMVCILPRPIAEEVAKHGMKHGFVLAINRKLLKQDKRDAMAHADP